MNPSAGPHADEARRHPTDAAGLMLPDPGWPAERQAPAPLEFVRRFGNSINRENGAERFRTPDQLDRWLIAEGRPAISCDAGTLAEMIAVRDSIHTLAVANTDGRLDRAAWERLSAQLRTASLVPAVGEHGLVIGAGAVGPLERLLGEIATICAAAVSCDRWRRLKACSHCGWLVYDHSRNNGGHWCSVSACGGRHNARQYRQRRRG